MSLRSKKFTERHLSASGTVARIEPEPVTGVGHVLSIAGADQSHVNLEYPTEIFYEYLNRIVGVVNVSHPGPAPLRIAHLGAGALTLARSVAVTHPGSEQWAVDIERELLDFVLRELPLPPQTRLHTIIGEIADSLDDLGATGAFDVVVLDVFSGPFAPPHLSTADFYLRLRGLLTESGVLIVNIGDEPPLTLVTSQIAAVHAAFGGLCLSASTEMFSKRYPGNMILAAQPQPWPAGWAEQLRARGPHPATVLADADVLDWS